MSTNLIQEYITCAPALRLAADAASTMAVTAILPGDAAGAPLPE
jgi:hypothetical protein